MMRKTKWLPLALTLMVGMVGAACDDEDNGTGPATHELPLPTNVQAAGAVASGGAPAVRVTWSAVQGAEGYSVERRVGGAGSYSTVGSNLTATEYVDSDVEEGQSYSYRVRAHAGTRSSDPSDDVDFSVGVRRATLSGTITGVRTLSADTTYFIRGTVIVDDGGELHIPAGTLLKGDVTVQPSALMVRGGGKLFSDGTASDPVVFTSSRAAGQRQRGDWGGVVLNGRSYCNFPAGECVGEGGSGNYGGTDVNDSSGRMTYTRIEFAGYEVSFGNELNALTLNGVGRGTELHHIQTHYGSDDGFEWFGGTVDLKYALATGISDDSFDYSTGWQGRGQFWIVQQDPNDADAGFEVDGNEDDYDATPLTAPTLYNLTLVGKGMSGQGGSAGESTTGMVLRRGTGGDIHNAIVMGFGTAGMDIDNPETVGRVTIRSSIIFGNASNFATDSDGIDEEAYVMNGAWGNRTVDPGLVAPFDRATPDFRPTAGSAATNGFTPPPSDDFFEPVSWVGAVAPGASAPWYEGWTTFAQN